jgi:hypothetical protein
MTSNDTGPSGGLFCDLAEAAKADQAGARSRLCSDPGGLTRAEARQRLAQFGPNELRSQNPQDHS